MAGRKLKLASEVHGHRTKTELDQRKDAESQMENLKDLQETPPKYLDATAARVWRSIIPELKKLPIKSIDKGIIVNYCVAYSLYLKAYQDVKENGIKTPDGAHKNPSVTIMNDNVNTMRQCSNLLGMNIDSRMKIFSSNPDKKQKDDNPFANGMFGDINA